MNIEKDFESTALNIPASACAWASGAAAEAYKIGRQVKEVVQNHPWETIGATAVIAGGIALITRGALADIPLAFRGAETLKSGSQIDAYLFDFDRTLIDTDKAFAAYSGTLRNELLTHSPLSAREIDAGMTAAIKARSGSIFLANDLNAIEPLARAHPGQNLNELYAGSVERVKAAYHQALAPRPDVVKMLDDVRQTGRPMMMYTAGSPAHTVEKLEASGLGKYFDTVFTGADNPYEDRLVDSATRSSKFWDNVERLGEQPKKDTSGYEQIIARRQLNPSRTLMVGDHAIEDIARSQQVGMKGALARYYTASPFSVTPDLVLNSAADLSVKLKLLTLARSA